MLGTANNLFLFMFRDALPFSQVMLIALNQNVTATSIFFAIGDHRHFRPTVALRVLGTINKAGKITFFNPTETVCFFFNRDGITKSSQRRLR
ncbi:Uncharacterised protein [Yersinia enterocolitica]|nr:Uncharacterised protein [Yersinia enterocolitica]